MHYVESQIRYTLDPAAPDGRRTLRASHDRTGKLYSAVHLPAGALAEFGVGAIDTDELRAAVAADMQASHDAELAKLAGVIEEQRVELEQLRKATAEMALDDAAARTALEQNAANPEQPSKPLAAVPDAPAEVVPLKKATRRKPPAKAK